MAAALRLFSGQRDQAIGQVSEIRPIGHEQLEIIGLIKQVFLKLL